MDDDEERPDEDQDRPEDEEQARVVDRGDPSAVVQVLPYVSHPISPELADHLVQTMEWREGDPLPSNENLIDDGYGNKTFQGWDSALTRYGPRLKKGTEGKVGKNGKVIKSYRRKVRDMERHLSPLAPAPQDQGADDDD